MQQETIIICSSIKYPYPKINLLLLNLILQYKCFIEMGKRISIGDYKIPKYSSDQNTLEILIENMRKWTENNSKSNLKICFLYPNL